MCDGADNDCNPATADGAHEPWLGDACDGPDADLCNEGTYSCSGGSQSCSDTTGDDLEVCDGADNDCDGATDEFTVTLTLDDTLAFGNPGPGAHGIVTALVKEYDVPFTTTVEGMEVTFEATDSDVITLSPMAELSSGGITHEAVANILATENGSGELSFTVVNEEGVVDVLANCAAGVPDDICASIDGTTLTIVTSPCETEMTISCNQPGHLITIFDTSEPVTVTVPTVTDASGEARALVEAKKAGFAVVNASIGCGVDGVAPILITTCDDDGDCSFLDDPCNRGVCNLDNTCGTTPRDLGTSCDDGLFCNGTNDTCNADGECIHAGNPCPEGTSCNEGTDSCDRDAPPPSYSVVLTPSTAIVESEETVQFEAETRYGQSVVSGTYTFEIVGGSSIGSDITTDGLYTAGSNDTPSDITETVQVTDTDHNKTDTSFVTVKSEIAGCTVEISPASAEVESNETVQFEATTTCGDEEVSGTYQWEVISTTIGSTINAGGLYTAGINTTGAGVMDTVQVTDTDNDATTSVEVTVLPQAPPACDITVTPALSTIDSGKTVTFTASIKEVGCLEPDFSWEIDSDPEVNSQITPTGATCLYTSGNNETGMLLDDIITISDSANGTSTDLTVSVLYGRILNVFPKTLFGSRWLYLPKVMFIIGEDTAFNGSTHPTFTPDDSITTIGQIGLGNLLGVLVLLPPEPEEGVVDLAVTTINGEGQTVVFPVEDALNIKLLPLGLDEEKNRP